MMDDFTPRSVLQSAMKKTMQQEGLHFVLLTVSATILCNIPGSGPCRLGFFQPAASGTDWGGRGHRYHKLAPHCSYHRLPAGQHIHTEGSLMSH